MKRTPHAPTFLLALLALGATQALGAVVEHTFVVEEWVVDFKRPTASLKKPARHDRLADSGFVIATMRP